MSGLVSGACYEYKWLHEATITTCVKQKPEPAWTGASLHKSNDAIEVANDENTDTDDQIRLMIRLGQFIASSEY